MTIFHTPKNENPIEYLYAALSIDDKGNEGIVAQIIPGMGGFPMVFGSKDKLDNAMPLIRDTVKLIKQKVRIFKFIKSDLLEEIEA